MTEDEMVGWDYQLNEHEFEQTPGDSEGQESLACCSLWGRKVTQRINNTTEELWICNLFSQRGPWQVLLRCGSLRGLRRDYQNSVCSFQQHSCILCCFIQQSVGDGVVSFEDRTLRPQKHEQPRQNISLLKAELLLGTQQTLSNRSLSGVIAEV